MTDKFLPVTAHHLLQIILKEYQQKASIFGIPKSLFFVPGDDFHLKSNIFGQALDTPIGVAAGPHSQMAQNIIGAWLMGARYIELKTIQTLDELEIPKPCIDMQDEGYNCEWSQELKIHESFNEYLNAWLIIHVLNHYFGWKQVHGTVFNMSAGYNLEGMMQSNVQWFFEKMSHCPDEINQLKNSIRGIYPAVDSIEIPACISNNITLSTMHGCPANEIEAIANYLLREKKLHTFVKLNPTLLGPVQLRNILNNQLGFKTNVPDEAFAHDLKYPDAQNIIRSLQATAVELGLTFGIKLSNTLESVNNKTAFDTSVENMYMSGRALHPLTVNLAAKLQNDFDGRLLLSFSGGADAFNVSKLLHCGFKTITVCTDLLKPGGYMRLHQYFEQLRLNYKSGSNSEEALINLKNYAQEVLADKAYRRAYLTSPSIKGNRPLETFDCITAPCRDKCATNQDIPDYLYHASKGDFEQAFQVILRTNPFPSTTGMVCDHLCQSKCTRINYDEPLLIREVKRFVSEQPAPEIKPSASNGLTVAIIGAGPSGLSAAYFLAMAGFKVEVFEAKSKAGGMVQFAIPGFRLTDEALSQDVNRIAQLGVNIQYNTRIDKAKFDDLQNRFNFVYIAAGAQLSAPYQLPGIENAGVLDSLEFLFKAKAQQDTGAGKHIVIIGGGNTAMDAARTAYRLVGENGSVRVVYRRTINEMPADQGEIKAVLEENISITELSAPEQVLIENGRVIGLRCSQMQLIGKDSSGRPKPVKLEGSTFDIACDTIIPAIGQALDIDFVGTDELLLNEASYATRYDNVFVGGDTKRGASTAINAIGDGRKAAEEIKAQANIKFNIQWPQKGIIHSKETLLVARSKREFAPELKELPFNDRKNFKLVSKTLNREEIIKESARCLHCDEICNICTTVCPNFANFGFETEQTSFQIQAAHRQDKGEIEIENAELFSIRQTHQILNIANFCNECGNCNMFCPTNSAPYLKKPKIYLTQQDFDRAANGFYFLQNEAQHILFSKLDNKLASLTEIENGWVFESETVIATLHQRTLEIETIDFKNNGYASFSNRTAAQMAVIMSGAKQLVFA